MRLNSSLMSEVRLTVKLKMMMMRLFNFKGKPPHDNKFGFLFVLSLAKHYHRAEKSRVSLFFTSPKIFKIYNFFLYPHPHPVQSHPSTTTFNTMLTSLSNTTSLQAQQLPPSQPLCPPPCPSTHPSLRLPRFQTPPPSPTQKLPPPSQPVSDQENIFGNFTFYVGEDLLEHR